MKNFEYFEKEIKEIAASGSSIAVINGVPVACGCIECDDCDFCSCQLCEVKIIQWLYEEHVVKPKISKRTKQFFEAIQTGWVARDCGGGDLYLYKHKPHKDERDFIWYSESDTSDILCSRTLDFLTLDFIKWEDEEPWSVEDILKLEVMED